MTRNHHIAIVTVGMIVGLVAGTWPNTAHPCDRPDANVDITTDGVPTEGVPTDSSLAFPVDLHSTDFDRDAFRQAVEIQATGPEGDPVAADVSVVEVWTDVSDYVVADFNGDSHRWLLLWTPTNSLTAQASYTLEFSLDTESLSITDAGTQIPDQFLFDTGESGAADLPEMTDLTFSAKEARVSENGAVSCQQPDAGGACPRCEFADLVDASRLTVELPAELNNPDVVYELTSDDDVVVDRQSTVWGGSVGESNGEQPELYLQAESDEVCGDLVARSLSTGDEVTISSKCTDVEPGPVNPGGDAGNGTVDAGPGDTGIPESDADDTTESDAGTLGADAGSNGGANSDDNSGATDRSGEDGCSTVSAANGGLPSGALLWLGLASALLLVSRRRNSA